MKPSSVKREATCGYCGGTFSYYPSQAPGTYCSRSCKARGNPKKARPLAERFWEKVDRSDASGCWPWTGGTFPGGYGSFRTAGRTVRGAHRVAYELQHGPIPAGVCVCHACDNPLCCRGDHLFLGTRRENNEDCERKGRRPRAPGEANGNAKLAAEQVVAIRSLVAAGSKIRVVAREFHVDPALVRMIVRRTAWKHVP